MAMQMETTYEFIHQANIKKYQIMLESRLNPEERRFIELRLAEEQVALQKLGRDIAPEGQSNHAA